MIETVYWKNSCLPDAPSRYSIFFLCDVLLVQNQTITVQNGTNF